MKILEWIKPYIEAGRFFRTGMSLRSRIYIEMDINDGYCENYEGFLNDGERIEDIPLRRYDPYERVKYIKNGIFVANAAADSLFDECQKGGNNKGKVLIKEGVLIKCIELNMNDPEACDFIEKSTDNFFLTKMSNLSQSELIERIYRELGLSSYGFRLGLL